MEFRFYLDELEVKQPGGFTDIVINIVRDKETHGMMLEASVSKLSFTGPGALYLENAKKKRGQKAEIIFKAEFRCETTDEWEELYYGKVNMGKYEKICGNECSVTITVEQSDCTMLVRNLYDQKVDMDSLKGFDGFTALQNYPKMGFEIDMPAKKLFVSVEGSVVDDGDTVSMEIFPSSNTDQFAVRPTYGNVKYESINESQLVPNVFAASDNGLNDSVLSPVLLLDDDIKCISGDLAYETRLKGSYDFGWKLGQGFIEYFRLKIATGEYPSALTVLHEQKLPISVGDNDEAVGTFDYNYSGILNLDNGKGFYAFLEAGYTGIALNLEGSITFDKETFVKISADKQCPPTKAKVYAINESWSRIVEAITNNCLRVRSDYYGRTDSLPYASEKDGCGSLRALNSGLQLRNAENAKFFMSLKDMFEGKNPIDNIGFGIEPDPLRPGYSLLRVEPMEYFYQDQEVLFCPNASVVNSSVDESRHYSTIKIGYEKWEVESVNGLEEINSTREYRTSLTSISNPLTKLSKFVTGSFPIEVTRQQSFAETGAADTKYDNDTFVYCMKRQSGNLVIEQGGVSNATNIFSPETLFNWKIRPIYSLMRWFKTIAASYSNLTDTDSKLYFTAGTGNYIASGEQTDVNCKLENGPKAENIDLRNKDFADTKTPVPLWRPEPIKYTYALSVSDLKKIKSNPYGFISVQCGIGDILQGYIDAIQYKPTQGEANFTLRQKW